MTLIMTHGVLHLNYLVGGLTPLKNISQIWLLFPIYGKINSCSKPPTSYLFHHPWTQQFLSGSQLWADASDAAGPKTAPDTLRPLVSKPHLRHAGCFMVSWPRCQITRGSWSSGWAGLMNSVCSLSIKKIAKKTWNSVRVTRSFAWFEYQNPFGIRIPGITESPWCFWISLKSLAHHPFTHSPNLGIVTLAKHQKNWSW